MDFLDLQSHSHLDLEIDELMFVIFSDKKTTTTSVTMSAATVTPVVSLWVKAEPFTYGALPVAPHPRLSFHVR